MTLSFILTSLAFISACAFFSFRAGERNGVKVTVDFFEQAGAVKFEQRGDQDVMIIATHNN